MAFNRNNVNLGNQFATAAAVASGEATASNRNDRPAFKLPEHIKYHKWIQGNQDINILLAEDDVDSGSYSFYKDIKIHELPNMADPKHPHRFPCLRMINQACPCCNEKDRLDNGDNWDEIKQYVPKKRTIYFMQNVKNGVGDSNVEFMECATSQKGAAAFPQKLMGAATAMSNGGGVIPFANPNSTPVQNPDGSVSQPGQIVVVNCVKDTFNGREYMQPNSIFFKPRSEEIPDEIYNKCPSWNSIINWSSAEDMEKAMVGDYVYTPESNRKQTANEVPSAPANQQQMSPTPNAQPQARTFTAQNGQQMEDPFPDQPTGFQTRPAEPTAGFQVRQQAANQQQTFDEPQRSFPSETPAAPAGQCPSGLNFGVDFDTRRACMNCPNHIAEACRKARG